jgi:hypothetical protein
VNILAVDGKKKRKKRTQNLASEKEVEKEAMPGTVEAASAAEKRTKASFEKETKMPSGSEFCEVKRRKSKADQDEELQKIMREAMASARRLRPSLFSVG